MNKLKLNKATNLTTPELNHHSPQSRRSRALAQALPTSQRRWNSFSHKQGFTIIEVVLVLAIAGLIFLMVFIALPALQRSQRDTQRKNDMSRILAATEQLRANNRGKIPNSYTDSEGNFRRTFNETLREHYLTARGDQFRDPDGSEYFFVDMIDSGDNYGRTDFSFKSTDGSTRIYTFW